MFSDRTNWKLTRNRLTEALDHAKARGVPVNDLTISNPTRARLKYDAQRILQSLSAAESLDYDPQPKGLRAAREAVSQYYREARAIELDPENLILTTSTSEGYSFIFRLLANPGDEVLVPKPSYPLFEFLADLCDVRLIAYPLLYDHGWQMDFHSLQDALTPRTRGVVVVHPNNPTGSFVHDDERVELNRICREHSLAIIADEVFLDYAHDRSRQQTFAGNEDALTFTLSGISKISALPQMKVAWVAVSGPSSADVSAALSRLEIIADTYLSMNAPLQWATPALLHQRKEIQRQLVDRVLNNLVELDRQLSAEKACQRLDVEGGWYAILRVPVIQSDEELAVELLEQKKVLVHPGHFYDFPSDGFLILSLITPQNDFCEGVKNILDHLRDRA
jgi:alanine-synthesizing transaminase